MKRIISSLVVLMLLLGIVSPSYATVNENKKINKELSKLDKEQAKMIKEVEPYVKVTEKGTLTLENVPKKFYNKYKLEKLEEHFDSLNESILNGDLTVNEDLSIQDNSISTYAVYGKWTYHWWGYDRLMSNSYANWYANEYIPTVAAGGTIITGATAPFPPISAVAGITTGTLLLLQARINANNEGNGVYVGVTWVLVFNVEPL